jgi:hypothetical protein
MGCDIHMFVEYASFETPEGADRYWSTFGSEFHMPRSYALFGLLAGVRGSACLFSPRGMPDDAGYMAAGADRLYISNSYGGERTTTPERAEQWVRSGASKYIKGAGGDNVWVTDPDNHSHSWLWLSDLEVALEALETIRDGYAAPLEYWALLAAMHTLRDGGRNVVRTVFWFDN